MTDKPEALRLADFCDGNVLYQPAAAELRRLHALNAQALEMLELYVPKEDYENRPVGNVMDALRAAIARVKGEKK